MIIAIVVALIGASATMMSPLLLWQVQKHRREYADFRNENTEQHGQTLGVIREIRQDVRETRQDVREVKSDLVDLRFDFEEHKKNPNPPKKAPARKPATAKKLDTNDKKRPK